MALKKTCKHEWRMKTKDTWAYDEAFYCIHCLAEATITGYERKFKIKEAKRDLEEKKE